MKQKVPPYLSYTTFQNFLDSLRATALPTRIDRAVMANMSGSNQALLLSTIRFLGLASDQGIPSDSLKQLVEAPETQQKSIWKRIVLKAYSDLLGSDLNLERTTTDELVEIFRKRGVNSPERLRKCLTFLTSAAKDAGIKLSPHIKPYTSRRQTARGTRIANADPEVNSPAEIDETQNGQLNNVELPRIPDFDPTWPEHVRTAWLDAYERVAIIRNKIQKEKMSRQAGT